MAAIEKWLFNQRHELKSNVKVIKGVTWLHITQDANVKEMIPRIGWRQTEKEDRTVPRISGAATIRGCIYGHSTVRMNILEGHNFNKDTWKEGKPIFHIYKMSGIDLLQPNKKLVTEADVSEELWIVPYSPETVTVKPERIGRIIPYRIVDEYIAGERIATNTFFIECKEPISIDAENTIGPGKFQFSIDGHLDPFTKSDVAPARDIGTITNQQWSQAMQSINKYT